MRLNALTRAAVFADLVSISVKLFRSEDILLSNRQIYALISSTSLSCLLTSFFNHFSMVTPLVKSVEDMWLLIPSAAPTVFIRSSILPEAVSRVKLVCKIAEVIVVLDSLAWTLHRLYHLHLDHQKPYTVMKRN